MFGRKKLKVVKKDTRAEGFAMSVPFMSQLDQDLVDIHNGGLVVKLLGMEYKIIERQVNQLKTGWLAFYTLERG